MGGQPDHLSCSQNAHYMNVVAGVIGTSGRASGWAGDKIRAVEGNLGHSLEER